MSEKPTALDPRHAVMARLDKLCDHFERAWKAGQRPDIAKYLAQAPPAEQSVLLRELIALDIDYRHRKGEQAVPTDYFDRFPEHRAEIEAAFARHHNDQSATESAGGVPAKQRQRGPYRVLREFAKGGVGQISIACDEPLKRHVALKELLGSAAKNPAGRNRFIREAKVTAQLSHPGVVPVYAFGMDRDGCPYYTMRLVEGQTLKEAIVEYHQSRSMARLRELLRRFVMVCQTIAYAHARGIVHRDLKPANIMLGEFGETLVLDWGLAKPIADGGSSQSTLGDVAQQQLIDQPEVTRPGAIVGTPSYMPPEQALGMSAEAGPAADIYGLGAVLYELLCGKPAFAGSSSTDVINKVRSTPAEPPSKFGTGVARPLEAICLKAMSREPKSRYATATAMAHDVQHWLDDEPVSAFEEPWPERAQRWARHHRTATVSGALMLFCLLIAGLVGIVALSRERARTVAAQQLAEDQARKAEEANAFAKQKEAEAQRLANEAWDWSEKAKQATEDALRWMQEVKVLEGRENELETNLAAARAKAAEAEKIKGELGLVRNELLALEARIAEKTEEARSAREQAQQAHEQNARFRAEADQLRELARTLSALASGQQPEPKVAEDKTEVEDFTEDSIANFDVVAMDGAFSLVTFDSSQKQSGAGSIRIDTLTEQEAYVTYPARRNANWDLRDKKYLTLSLFTGSGQPVEVEDVWVRMGRGSSHVEFRAKAERIGPAGDQWLNAFIPLAGGGEWVRSDINQPDLSHVDWIEIHTKATKGLTLWVDELGFSKIGRTLLVGPAPGMYPTLEAALDSAVRDEVIEIRTDGPLYLVPGRATWEASAGTLTVRAGDGFRPVLVRKGSQPGTGSRHQPSILGFGLSSQSDSSAIVQLEGLDFLNAAPHSTVESAHCLKVRRCVFASGGDTIRRFGNKSEFEDCYFRGIGGRGRFLHLGNGDVVVKNNLFVECGNGNKPLQCLQRCRATIVHNTYVHCGPFFGLHGGGNLIDSRDNLFVHSRGSMMELHFMQVETREQVRELFTYQGSHNVFRERMSFGITGGGISLGSMDAWQYVTNNGESESTLANPLWFGDPLFDPPPDDSIPDPSAFAIRPGSPALRIGSDGQSVGADLAKIPRPVEVLRKLLSELPGNR